MSEQIRILKPRKALNKAFLKVKPNRTEIECFKTNLIQLLDRINDSESEEFHKNLVSDFLKDTYYKQNHFINTKGRNDLVIHNTNSASGSVGVIIEAKKPTNKGEMLTQEKINVKAFQELVLYYLRERITQKNIEIKYLIATNINEWFIFDATLFDRLFAQNKNLVKQFTDFEDGRLADTKTDFFYKQIAEPFIAELKHDIEFTYFDIRDYEKPLRNDDKKDDNQLIALFKLLSPQHLLKLPFANDSNSLDKRFYGELLHIIGLTETKDGSKKLIERNKEGERNTGSLIENAIIQLDSLDKISRIENPSQFGANLQERLFNVGLELSITWINRILFLKLLEAQLITYHKGDKSYEFLSIDKIKDYDDLNSLFFQVLARKQNERNDDVNMLFAKVPYLNSSLFEPTEIEHTTIFISNLRNDKTLPIYSQTVLKDSTGKKRTGNINPLEYLFDFLNAYDFASEGSAEIQEDNKTLINASVLGLIFEKINGYKDGSFFTPGFITMYMCRETIRKAVIEKVNQRMIDSGHQNWKPLETLTDVYNQVGERMSKRGLNQIINNIKICDPAVGSGHFLVSALNEIIAIKSDLGVLMDKEGKLLRDYTIEVVNDELIVTDEDGELFEYNPTNKESQRVQETLFHEKQTIIENCLFGVDINPNSVKICRLRLWIELLKNAYYIQDPVQTHDRASQSRVLTECPELQTLPNIDINIKCGNSLISRFALDSDLKQALKKSASKWTIDSYRLAVDTYRNAQSKEQKREMERLINEIKTNFRSEISQNDPKVKRLSSLNGELFMLTNQGQLFELSKKEKAEWNAKVAKLTADTQKLETEIEEIKSNKIYGNAFEWRFEFPEVLDDNGDFVGFDVVIGNPPYIQLQSIKDISEQLKQFNYQTYEKTSDIYSLFYEKGNQILKNNGYLAYITSNKWMRAGYGKTTRNYFLQHTQPVLLIDLGSGVFEEATVDSNILIFKKQACHLSIDALDISKEKNVQNFDTYKNSFLPINPKIDESWTIAGEIEQNIKAKIEAKGIPLKDWDVQINYGIKTGYNEAFIIDGKKKDELIAQDPKSAKIIKPILRGRDIKRYQAEFADLWLIYIPKGFTIKTKIDNNIVEEPKPRYGYIEFDEAWEWFQLQFPAIASHLLPFKAKAEKRADMGDYWWEQRACAYLEEFEKEKIVFQEMVQFSSFIYDMNQNYLCLDTGRIITGENLKFLITILNSKLFFYLVKYFYGGGGLGEKGVRMKHTFFENIPVPKLSAIEQQPFIELVEKILQGKEKGKDTTEYESQIDQLVYQLYDLTADEITIIENSVK